MKKRAVFAGFLLAGTVVGLGSIPPAGAVAPAPACTGSMPSSVSNSAPFDFTVTCTAGAVIASGGIALGAGSYTSDLGNSGAYDSSLYVVDPSAGSNLSAWDVSYACSLTVSGTCGMALSSVTGDVNAGFTETWHVYGGWNSTGAPEVYTSTGCLSGSCFQGSTSVNWWYSTFNGASTGNSAPAASPTSIVDAATVGADWMLDYALPALIAVVGVAVVVKIVTRLVARVRASI